MNRPPAFQFYARTWLTSRTVSLMTPEDQGLYIKLLCIAWDSEDPGILVLPVPGFNPRTVRSFILRWPKTFVSSGAEFDPNLSPTEAERRLNEGRKKAEIGLKFTNPFLRDQYTKLCEFSEKRRKAAGVRWDAHALQVQCSSSSSSSASSINTKEPPISPPLKSDDPEVPDWMPTIAWNHWLEMRKKIPRCPFTARSKLLVIRSLTTLRSSGQDVEAVIEQATVNGWKDFYALRTNGDNASNGNGNGNGVQKPAPYSTWTDPTFKFALGQTRKGMLVNGLWYDSAAAFKASLRKQAELDDNQF